MTEPEVESKTQPQNNSIHHQDDPCCSREEHVINIDATLESDEKFCRICHLSNGEESCQEELIQLGCHCREDLGLSHRHCAETWFKQKGNRLVGTYIIDTHIPLNVRKAKNSIVCRICEICNKAAKNVRFVKDPRTTFVMEINEMRPAGVSNGASVASFEFTREAGSSRRCNQSCSFFLTCLLLAFLSSTFLRIKLF